MNLSLQNFSTRIVSASSSIFTTDKSWSFTLRILLAVCAYYLFNYCLPSFGSVGSTSYFHSTFLLDLVKHSMTGMRVIILAAAVAFLFIYRKRALAPWSALSTYPSIRIAGVACCAILAWTYSSYDYNMYFNQGHIIERLALLVFIPLIWWRPIFILPFSVLVYAVVGQFQIVPGFSWTIPYLPLHMISAFCALGLLYVLSGKITDREIIFILLCILGAHYWSSGTGKLSIFWLFGDPIHHMLPATYANGWLGQWPVDQLEHVTNVFSQFNPIIRNLVVILELGTIALIFHRRISILLGFGLVAMHLGIFFASGIFFWPWMLVNLLLIFALSWNKNMGSKFSFTWQQKGLFMVLIISSSYWSSATKLAWHDVPLSYTYVFECEDTNDKKYRLPVSFFEPFGYQFTLGTFGSINPHSRLPITWGASDMETAFWFRKMQPNPEEIFAYEKEKGVSRINEEAVAHLTQVLQQIVSTWNQNGNIKSPLEILSPPRYLWTHPRKLEQLPGKIKMIRVLEKTTLYHEKQYQEIRNIELLSVPVSEETNMDS